MKDKFFLYIKMCDPIFTKRILYITTIYMYIIQLILHLINTHLSKMNSFEGMTIFINSIKKLDIGIYSKNTKCKWKGNWNKRNKIWILTSPKETPTKHLPQTNIQHSKPKINFVWASPMYMYNVNPWNGKRHHRITRCKSPYTNAYRISCFY